MIMETKLYKKKMERTKAKLMIRIHLGSILKSHPVVILG